MVEGRVLKDILKADTFIVLRYMDGTSHTIGWRDGNGPVKGEPYMKSEGWHIFAKAPRVGIYRQRDGGLLVPE